MDGVYPLFAGAAPEERRERLLAHIKNPDENVVRCRHQRGGYDSLLLF